jgi:hypothetical protein
MSRRQIAAVIIVGILTFLAASAVDGIIAQAAAPGDRGAEVVELQKDLRALGYVAVTPDGSYGPRTERAVRHFQRANGLKVDGVAGPVTTARINSATVATQPAARLNTPDPAPVSPPSQASGPCAEWADELAFFSPGWDVARMQQIMNRESRCRPDVTSNTGCCRGLLQIHSVHIRNLGPCGVYSPNDLFDPGKNICAAAIVYSRAGGLSPWSL